MEGDLRNKSGRRVDTRASSFWRAVETGIYTAVAAIIALTAVIALCSSGFLLWHGLRTRSSWDTLLPVIDRLLLVLMLVEILNTVRISIRSHALAPEPFLIVGLIATIRRVLVIALEAVNLSFPQAVPQVNETVFRQSVTELVVLGFVIFVLVFSIWLLRRSRPSPEEEVL